MKKGVFGKFLVVMAFCILFLLCFSGCGLTEVDISNCVDVVFNGINGEGTAVVTSDELTSSIQSALLGEKDSLEEAILVYEEASILSDSVSFELDKKENLSNGEKVTVTITVNEEFAKENGIKFIGTEPLQFTVSDLQEITELDAFDPSIFNVTEGEGVYIEFTGISPMASIQIRNTLPSSNPLSEVTYTANGFFNVKKGDEITVEAFLPYTLDDEYRLKENSTVIKCEKVSEYISSLDDIDEETWSKIKAQCEDLKKANIDSSTYVTPRLYFSGEEITQNSIDKAESLSNFKYSNAYLLCLKEGATSANLFSSGFSQNAIFISYTLDVNKIPTTILSSKDKAKDFKDTSGYFVVSDLVKNKDGEIEFSISQVKLGFSMYINEEEMKMSEINKYVDKYTLTEEKVDWK